VTAAMDLFGRQGYHATTIAQIEAAAGLSAGAGGLYRHFKSKRAVLEEGLDRQASAGRQLVDYLSSGAPPANRQERFLAVARAGFTAHWAAVGSNDGQPVLIAAAACLGGDGPTAVVTARTVTAAGFPDATLAPADRTSAAAAACSYPA